LETTGKIDVVVPHPFDRPAQEGKHSGVGRYYSRLFGEEAGKRA
jgi:hypothetical protein